MMVYKDRSWCWHSTEKKCINTECYRNYSTEEQLINETRVDLPLSIADHKTDDCGFEEALP